MHLHIASLQLAVHLFSHLAMIVSFMGVTIIHAHRHLGLVKNTVLLKVDMFQSYSLFMYEI